MSTIIDVYESILGYVNLEHDTSNGGIVTRVGDDVHPFMLKNQFDKSVPVVLPTSEQLRSGTQADKVIFHPLAEDLFVEEESAVMRAFARVVNNKLNHVVGRVMLGLVTLLSTPDEHQHLTEAQMELLIQIADVEKGAVDALWKVIKEGDRKDPSRVFIYLYLKRKSTIGGKLYGKGGIITFPFYDGLKAQTGKPKKHTELYMKVLEFMLPGLGNHDMYSYGSNADVAPYFDSLMVGSKGVTDRLNKIITIYESYLSKLYDDLDSMRFSMEWVKYFDNIDNLRVAIKSVPSQIPPAIDKVVVEPMAPLMTHSTPRAQPAATRQTPPSAPVARPSTPVVVNGKVSVDQFLAANPSIGQPPPPPQGYYPPQGYPPQQGYYPPQQYPQQGYGTYQQPLPPPPPPPRSYRPEPRWSVPPVNEQVDQYGRVIPPKTGTSFY
jgi:hypothetical protein